MRRLYEVKVYAGDPDDPKTEVVTETVVAWNDMDAMRRVGARRAAEQPKALHYVTWSDDSGGLYRIDDTAGPDFDSKVEPTIATEDDEDWGDPYTDRSAMAEAETKTAEKTKRVKKGK